MKSPKDKTNFINKFILSDFKSNEMTILDLDKSKLFTFNITAKFIYKKLKLGLTASAIVKRIEKKFKISKLKAEKDVENIIEIIKKYKLDKASV